MPALPSSGVSASTQWRISDALFVADDASWTTQPSAPPLEDLDSMFSALQSPVSDLSVDALDVDAQAAAAWISVQPEAFQVAKYRVHPSPELKVLTSSGIVLQCQLTS